jgi:ribosomal protein S15P/S13E
MEGAQATASTHTTSAALNQDEGPTGGPLKCPECDSMFAKANKLKRHLQNVHQDVVSKLTLNLI